MSCIFEISLPLCNGCTTRRDCWSCDKLGDWIRDRMDIEQHGDLISRSALKKRMKQVVFDIPLVAQIDVQTACETCEAIVDVAPAIEAEPVRRGRWELTQKDCIQCSECHKKWAIRDRIDFIIFEDQKELKWCPSCGARMDAR